MSLKNWGFYLQKMYLVVTNIFPAVKVLVLPSCRELCSLVTQYMLFQLQRFFLSWRLKSLSAVTETMKVPNPSPAAVLLSQLSACALQALRTPQTHQPAAVLRKCHIRNFTEASSQCYDLWSPRPILERPVQRQIRTTLGWPLLVFSFSAWNAPPHNSKIANWRLPLLAWGGAATKTINHWGRKRDKHWPRNLNLPSLVNERRCAVLFNHNALPFSPFLRFEWLEATRHLHFQAKQPCKQARLQYAVILASTEFLSLHSENPNVHWEENIADRRNNLLPFCAHVLLSQ